MIDYRAGTWGFHVAFTHCINGSLVPKALAMAVPNAILTFLVSTLIQQAGANDFESGRIHVFHEDTAAAASMALGAFTTVMTFILYNRSSIAYDRWWEGGTLLQKTRGEWFNAYSSIMAFTSTKPELQPQVDEYQHLLARLMSLLMCCGLQQVSPNRERPFEIYHLGGIEPDCIDFLNSAPDKVEIILQWIQRSMVLHSHSGVLPVAPPILSRAFQEFSRGIVNLQNARKIADFPYPYPLAQISMILQILHWVSMPLGASLAVPRFWAVLLSFFSIFVLWCIHFNAIELEFPFGDRTNDLPMVQLQQDWNDSVWTLLDRRATVVPGFDYQPELHNDLSMAMSDASEFLTPRIQLKGGGSRCSSSSIKMSPPQKVGKGRRLSKVSSDSAGSSRITSELFSDPTQEGTSASTPSPPVSDDTVASGTSAKELRQTLEVVPEQDGLQMPATSTDMPTGAAQCISERHEDAEVLRAARVPPTGIITSLRTGAAEQTSEEVNGSGIAMDVRGIESANSTHIKPVARSSNDVPASAVT